MFKEKSGGNELISWKESFKSTGGNGKPMQARYLVAPSCRDLKVVACVDKAALLLSFMKLAMKFLTSWGCLYY